MDFSEATDLSLEIISCGDLAHLAGRKFAVQSMNNPRRTTI